MCCRLPTEIPRKTTRSAYANCLDHNQGPPLPPPQPTAIGCFKKGAMAVFHWCPLGRLFCGNLDAIFGRRRGDQEEEAEEEEEEEEEASVNV